MNAIPTSPYSPTSTREGALHSLKELMELTDEVTSYTTRGADYIMLSTIQYTVDDAVRQDVARLIRSELGDALQSVVTVGGHQLGVRLVPMHV